MIISYIYMELPIYDIIVYHNINIMHFLPLETLLYNNKLYVWL